MKNKPDYWYNQSSVIPFRVTNDNIEVLLIRTKKDKKWIFPKGIIETNLSSRDSAIKETLEEAGVIGELLEKKIGKYSYKKWGGKCIVNIYGMRVEKVLTVWEEDFRKRVWVNIENIEEYVTGKKLLSLVENIKLLLKKD